VFLHGELAVRRGEVGGGERDECGQEAESFHARRAFLETSRQPAHFWFFLAFAAGGCKEFAFAPVAP
jgi:hypothetical protein